VTGLFLYIWTVFFMYFPVHMYHWYYINVLISVMSLIILPGLYNSLVSTSTVEIWLVDTNVLYLRTVYKDTKETARHSKSKDRQHNKMKNDKSTNNDLQNITQKI